MGNVKNIFKTLNRSEKILIFSFFVISIFQILIELLSIALIPLVFSALLDFDTGNVRYKVRERYSFGFTDWRGIFGTGGA